MLCSRKVVFVVDNVRVPLDQESYANTQTGLIKHTLNHSRLNPEVVNKHLSPFLTAFTHMHGQQPLYPARTILFLHNTGCKSCFSKRHILYHQLHLQLHWLGFMVHFLFSNFSYSICCIYKIISILRLQISFTQLLSIGTYCLYIMTFTYSLKPIKGACCCMFLHLMFYLLWPFDSF